MRDAGAEAMGDAAAALYRAGGQGATVDEVHAEVQAALGRGDYGDDAAAAARSFRSFTSAQAMLHGARGLEEEDRLDWPWSTLGRPPEGGTTRRFGIGFDAASRV